MPVSRPVGDRAHDLDEVGFRDAVRQTDPAAGGRARGVDGEHLDDGDAPLGETRRLAAPDEAAAKDDGEVGRHALGPVERSRAGIDLEAGVLQKRQKRRLTRRQKEDSRPRLTHVGILPAEPSFEAPEMGSLEGMKIQALDHVALWIDERDRLAEFLVAEFGMHVIERTDMFTLVGGDARRGKLTLFAAEGPRERGVLAEIAIRVPAEAPGPPEALLGPGGVPLERIESEDEVADLDHVTFRVPAPERALAELVDLGFVAENGHLRAGSARVELERGEPQATERPLLNHLGLRVDSAAEHIREARRRGLEIADVVDGPNTLAVFVWGPDRIKLEYVEHKASFSLV